MPTTTFFNLPKEKQEAIFEAATKEFSRVSFHDASINQMIMNAGISRGSFYMYFKDKADLYHYLVQMYQKKLEQCFITVLKDHQGDLIDTYLALFQMVVRKMQVDKERSFFEKIILNVNFRNDPVLNHHEKKAFMITEMLSLFDKRPLNITSDEELLEVIDLIHMLFIHSLVKVLKGRVDVAAATSTYQRQLIILKEGLYHHKEEKK